MGGFHAISSHTVFIPGMAAAAGGKVPDMSMILTAKNTHEVKIAPGKTNLHFAAKGGAKLSLDGHTVFAQASCGRGGHNC